MRQGGPKMKASAAYPRGYARRLFKLHKPFMVFAWVWFKNISFGNIWISSKVEKNDFMKNFVQKSVAKIQQSPVRARYLVQNTLYAISKPPSPWGFHEWSMEAGWPAATSHVFEAPETTRSHLNFHRLFQLRGMWPWATVRSPWATPQRHGLPY